MQQDNKRTLLKPVICNFTCLFLLLSFFSCSNQENGQEAKKGIETPQYIRNLNNVTIYPETSKTDTVFFKKAQGYKKYFGDPNRLPPIAVDNLNRVYIANKPKLAIDVYNSEGRFMTSLGREGRGPGEFLDIKWLKVSNNHLYVYDRKLKQLQVFSLQSLSHNSTVPVLPTNLDRFLYTRYMAHNPVNVISDSTFLYRFRDMSELWDGRNRNHNKEATMDISFFILNKNRYLKPDTLLHQKGRKAVLTERAMVYFPFTRKPLFALSSDQQIYAANSNDFLIKVYSLEGKYLRAFYYPYKRAPLRESQIDSVIQNTSSGMQDPMRKVSRQTNLPTTWPTLNSMKIDDENRLWISTIVKNQNIHQWWVMNQKGKLLARFRLSRDKPIKAIKNDFVYTIESNMQNGTFNVNKYKIDFKSN